jgi:hypothetical protein
MSDLSGLQRPSVADKPSSRETSEHLRLRIPGWGVDLDPQDRPSGTRERFDPGTTGAHWAFPDRQEDVHDRERSIEHGMLPPVFGTVAPLHGLSGLIRRAAYARFSEARLSHWLLLMLGDRVEAIGAHATTILAGRPGNPVEQTGVRTERFEAAGSARRDPSRADRSHRWVDPLVVAVPWVVSGWLALRVIRRISVFR